MMKRLLAFLALALVAASLSDGRIIKREVEYSLTHCREIIAWTCILPHIASFHEYDLSSLNGVVALVRNREKLVDFAFAVHRAVACAETERNRPICVGVSEEDISLPTMRFVAEYLSSPSRLDLVHEAAYSPCLTNSTKLDQLGQKSAYCLATSMQTGMGSSDMCAGIQALRTCSINTGTSVCGAEMGALFQNLWAYTSQPELDASALFSIIPDENIASFVMNCNKQNPTSVKRSFNKRALRFLEQSMLFLRSE
ncbi:hypothetical protein ElyMa_004449400 [Elysia marginata]|uniref:Transferrin-like domain-containing protein n=1 Tax=Elysia marginata TaxID=1093978 RepID=A0AAV4HFX4_9GAST|nr:hypothetical protein ElyMa_004449400 [Elysia marginata]